MPPVRLMPRMTRTQVLAGVAALTLTASMTAMVDSAAHATDGDGGSTEPSSSVAGEWEAASATANERSLPDGSTQLRVFQSPVNYQDGAEWAPIDNELVEPANSAFAAENKAGGYSGLLPVDAESTPVVFKTDGVWVRMKMDGLGDAEPTVVDDSATYPEVEGADEVRYTATNTGLKEDIILDEAPSSQPVYTYRISASPGLELEQTASGQINFVDSTGHAAVSIPVGVMNDSAAAESFAVDYEVSTSGSGWMLSITPSLNWLSDPARAYPVTVDPSLVIAPARDCAIGTGNPNTSHCATGSQDLKAGVTDDGRVSRSLLSFPLGAIPANSSITEADLSLYMQAGDGGPEALYEVRTAGMAFTNNATWNSSGTSAWTGGNPGTVQSTVGPLTGTVAGWKTFEGLEPTVQDWIDGHVPNHGLVLKQRSEVVKNILTFYSDSANNAASRRPHLDVTYEPIVEATLPLDDIELSYPDVLGVAQITDAADVGNPLIITPNLAPGTHLRQEPDGSIIIVDSQDALVATVIIADVIAMDGQTIPTQNSVVGNSLVSEIQPSSPGSLEYPLTQAAATDIVTPEPPLPAEPSLTESPRAPSGGGFKKAGCRRFKMTQKWGAPVSAYGMDIVGRFCWKKGTQATSRIRRISGDNLCWSNFAWDYQNCIGPRYRDKNPFEDGHVSNGYFSNLYYFMQTRVCGVDFLDIVCTGWQWSRVGVRAEYGGHIEVFGRTNF